jgi:hypothetical protein
LRTWARCCASPAPSPEFVCAPPKDEVHGADEARWPLTSPGLSHDVHCFTSP